MRQSNVAITCRISVDDSTDRAIDGRRVLNVLQAAITVDGEGAQGAIRRRETLIQAVESASSGIKSELVVTVVTRVTKGRNIPWILSTSRQVVFKQPLI